MRFTISCFVFLFILSVLIKAQNTNVSRPSPDTSAQRVIIEYDTVYTTPDTIKMVDTIIHYIQKNPHKKNVSHNFSIKNIFYPFNRLYYTSKTNTIDDLSIGKEKKHNWSILLYVEPYINGLISNGKINDSTSFTKELNMGYYVGFIYHKTRYVYTIGLGYTSLSEEIQYQNQYYSNTRSISGSTYYDSLLLQNKVTAFNSYKYLDIFFTIGYQWPFRIFSPGFAFMFNSDVLLQHTAIPNSYLSINKDLQSTSFRILNFSYGFKPYLDILLSRQVHLIFAPIYSHSINNTNKYPLTLFSKTGLDIGLSFLL